MNSFFRRLPLPVKLVFIALLPILFIVLLSVQLYREKTRNVAQIKLDLDQIAQSAIITRLVDQLQRELRVSYDYLLSGNGQVAMLAERPKTDSLLQSIEARKDPFLKGFQDYMFLENLDSTRSKIDRLKYPPGTIMHFYSNAIFRLSTLNSTPFLGNTNLRGVYSDLMTQKLLSEMITYLGLVNSNVYNVLYTRQYAVETLLGSLGTYDVYRSYDKQLLETTAPEVRNKYELLRTRGTLKPVSEYLGHLFTSFRFDSTYSALQWRQLADRSTDELRQLQMGLLQGAERGMEDYYRGVEAARTRAIVLLVVSSLFTFLLAAYMVFLLNDNLSRLRRAALKIAKGETDVRIVPYSRDTLGSLADSIIKIDQNNKELAAAARKIGQGDFAHPLKPRSVDDALGNAILQMQQSLNSFTQDLRKSREEFKSLAELMPQIVWTARPNGQVDYYNSKWFEITGARAGYNDQTWLPVIHPQDVGACLGAWHHSVETGTTFEMKFRFRDVRSGGYRWFLSRALPVRDEDGNISKWFGTATDIHDQIVQHERLEELVAERTLELKRSNEDLQQFAHVASHDLKEPLRKIRTFSNRLSVEFGGLLPEKGRVYLNKLETSSERMSNMIESVLNYSVVNANELAPERVDLNLVVDGIRNDLELLILQKDAQINCGSLPTIVAAPALLYQLFYNLINNALKFSREKVAVRVDITSREISGEQFPELAKNRQYVEIVVKDNGIGFNQEHAEKMFHVFSRLNSREKYEGTGLGLALCRKIVHRHYGLIFAEGIEGQGAKFSIILPLR